MTAPTGAARRRVFMRNAPGDRPVLPSVLDRLLDNDRKAREDAPITRAQSIRELKASLQRDLEWLLNTRRIVQDLPETSEELIHSLYTYGLPEFRELSQAAAGDLIAQHIASAIRI